MPSVPPCGCRVTPLWCSVWTVFLAFLALAAVSPARAQTPPRRPDIVIFLADDLSLQDCSLYGGKDIPTPNLAALAREGLTFDRAHVASPSCAPSRAALLTGCYPARNGAMFNHQQIHPDLRKWPAYFQALGYETAAIGKVSHYAHVMTYGFDYAAFYHYHEDICVEEAVKWLAARKSDKPLCLFVGTNWSHVPWPKEFALPPPDVHLPAKIADTPRTRQARARYDKAVENADRDLGLVREAVRRYLPADTFFLFSSDHGSQFPFAKWNLYEAGLNVPLVAVWPGHIAPDKRTAALVSWIDVLPTALGVAGADPARAAPSIDGRSFLPVLLGQSATGRDAVFASHSGDGNLNFFPSRAVSNNQWKYIRNLEPDLEFHTHVDRAPGDTGYWPSWVRQAPAHPEIAALIEKYHHRPAEELYDLARDPDEQVNLAADPAHAADLHREQAKLDTWMKSLGDQGSATDRAAKPNEKPPADTPDP